MNKKAGLFGKAYTTYYVLIVLVIVFIVFFFLAFGSKFLNKGTEYYIKGKSNQQAKLFLINYLRTPVNNIEGFSGDFNIADLLVYSHQTQNYYEIIKLTNERFSKLYDPDSCFEWVIQFNLMPENRIESFVKSSGYTIAAITSTSSKLTKEAYTDIPLLDSNYLRVKFYEVCV
jgi:hypothetical protein